MKPKKYLMILLLPIAIFPLDCHAHSVNGVPIAELNAEYIEISGTGKLLSSAVTVEIDFGQLDTSLGNKKTEIRDENGKPVAFNSMIDALNFMSKLGYELVQVYVMPTNGGSARYFIMKKKTTFPQSGENNGQAASLPKFP